MAEITFKAAMITSSVVKFHFCGGLDNFKSACDHFFIGHDHFIVA